MCTMRLFLVVVGRAIMYGFALGGEEGVEQVLWGLLADVGVTFGPSGYKGMDEILRKRDAVPWDVAPRRAVLYSAVKPIPTF